MPTKIRLARHGRKNFAYYHIVVADSRAPRDGRRIERIGSYNPNTNPATIDLDFEKALYWVSTGAQPTETVRGILSEEGVLFKKHLLGGVKKGAFSAEQAEVKFEAWKKEKEASNESKLSKMSEKDRTAAAARMKAETKIKDARIAAIAAKNAPKVEEPAEEAVTEEEVASEE